MKIPSGYILFFFALLSCTRPHVDHATLGTTSVDTARYTCPMHPQIVRANAGNCPICNMALVEISAAKENYLMLTESQMRLANITTGIATKRPVGEMIVINGTLKVNQDYTQSITSRAEGRVEKLYVKETGQPIRKGEPLYILYSESLLTLQQEYLLAKDQYESMEKTEKRYKSFMDAAERKLLLYGMTKHQIAKLKRDSAAPRTTFLSPVNGIITEIRATEGQYVQEGGLLFQVDDLSTLWLQAELYPNESSLIKRGDKITISATGSLSGGVDAQVDFLSPEYQANTQIVLMRAVIKNTELKFRPGQQVQVFVSRGSRDAVAIPTNAVIRDGNGSHVYIQTARNTFQPKMVRTGIETFDQTEILDGLMEGDTLAITGAYLLYSELTLKGTNPMAGHHH